MRQRKREGVQRIDVKVRLDEFKTGLDAHDIVLEFTCRSIEPNFFLLAVVPHGLIIVNEPESSQRQRKRVRERAY